MFLQHLQTGWPITISFDNKEMVRYFGYEDSFINNQDIARFWSAELQLAFYNSAKGIIIIYR